MVSSLSSALPLDSPRFSSLFFISSCREATHQPLWQAALLADQAEAKHLSNTLLREATELIMLLGVSTWLAGHISLAVKICHRCEGYDECRQSDS